MKFCTNCGETIKNDANKFCGTCGSLIPKGEGAQSAASASDGAATSQVVEPALPVQPTSQEGASPTAEPGVSAQPISQEGSGQVVEPGLPVQPLPQAGPIPPATHSELGQEGTPGKKKRMSTGLKVALACVIVVAIILSAVAAVFASGVGGFVNSVERFRNLQRLSIFEPLASAVTMEEYEDFSTDIIINAGIEGEGFMLALVSPVIEQFMFEIGIEVDADTMESMVGVAATIGGESIISSVMTFDDENFGFYIPELGRHYTIGMEALTSLFAGVSADMREIMEITADWTGEESGLLIERYGEIILATVNSNNLNVSRNETITLFDGQEEVRVTMYTFAPCEEELFEMLMAILEEARDDDDLFALLGGTMAGLRPPTETRSLRRQWDDTIVGLMDELEDAFEDGEMGIENFVWRTARAGTELHLQEISFEMVDGRHVDTVVIRYEGMAGRDGARTDWIVIEGADGGITTLRNEMARDEEYIEGDFGIYILESNARREERFLQLSYRFTPDERSILRIPYGLYEMTIWPDFAIPGSAPIPLVLEVEEGRRGGSDHMLSIRGIPELEREGITALFLNIHSTDEPTTMRRPTGRPIDLSGLSEWELDDLLFELERELERHIEDIMFDFMPF